MADPVAASGGNTPRLPTAETGTAKTKIKLRRLIAQRRLVGATNDTKWNRLLDVIRPRDGWTPSYRYGWIKGHVSNWDAEWLYHLPLPFLGVEWLDIGLHQPIRNGRLLPTRIVDHGNWLLPEIAKIGFDHVVAGDVVRLFGYLPRDTSALTPMP